MNATKHLRTYLLLCSLVVALQPLKGFAQSNSDALRTNLQQTLKEREGEHDFDFEIGTWKTHLRRLLHPLTGSTTWVEYEGTSVVRKVWNGRANLVELVADGPAGHFEGLNLRLYNPQSHQWSLNFASRNAGVMSQSSSTRKHSMAEPSLFDSLSRTSPRILAVLNSHSRMMVARLGK